MNVQRQSCSRQTIELFLAGQLTGDELQAFEEHLDDCPSCRECLDSVAAEGTWWEEARGYLSSSDGLRWPGLAHREGEAPAEQGPSRPAGASPSRCPGHPGDEAGEETPAGLAALQSYLAPSDDPRMLGRLGGYEILGCIGWGGMGIVLKGFDVALNRCVAIKVLGPQLALSGAARQRFAREARAAAAVVHDNVVAIHAVAEANGLPYFVMPYLRGPSLEKRLQQTGALAVVEVLRIGRQIASGLAAAHAQGLVHRDVKPANILLGEGVERVTLTDFGLARAVDDASLTQSGTIAGTPQYMSPEQAAGVPVDHRADLFSLGSVLYALCTGRPPFRAPGTLGVLRRVAEDRPRPIRDINPDIPEWLVALIDRLHEKAPADRFQSAAEVAALLEGYLAHRRQPDTVPAPVLPLSPAESRFEAEPVPKTGAVGRIGNPSYLAAAAFLLLAALGLGLTRWWLAAGPAGNEGKPGQFHQDFRFLDPHGSESLRPVGQIGLPDDKGMRITVPAGPDLPLCSGYMTAFAVHGDFEATFAYEILKVDQPDRGFGVGVTLYAAIDPTAGDAVSLARRVTKEGDTIFVSDRMKPADGKLSHRTKERPSTSATGKLRLRRVGSRMLFFVADGLDAEFVQLNEVEFGTADVRPIQVGGNSGRSNAGLDFRLLNFTVRAADMPGRPDPAPASLPKAMAKEWLVAVEVAGLVVTLALLTLGALYFARRGRGRGPAPATDPHPPTGASGFLTFPCPGCGKSIRARVELAGKKGRCVQCGTGIQVPPAGACP
jgi:serine/threonine protein kinase